MKVGEFGCCIDCQDREVGCHSTCERYIKAKADYEEKNSKRKERENTYAELDSYSVDVRERLRKGHYKRR